MIGIYIIAGIVLLSILPPVIHGLKDKERRQNIKATIKKTASRKK